jgi:hypothetical protein
LTARGPHEREGRCGSAALPFCTRLGRRAGGKNPRRDGAASSHTSPSSCSVATSHKSMSPARIHGRCSESRPRFAMWTLLGKRTRKPNSVLRGHSSRRGVTANAHQRPTRRFRRLLEPPGRIGPIRKCRLTLSGTFPPYLVLLRVGFTMPPPLPSERCALTAPFHPYPGCPISRRRDAGKHEAVCSLWHWPSTGLEARIPDVIRHTTLRSSDFPPPVETTGSDRPVPLPALVYLESRNEPRTGSTRLDLGITHGVVKL